jgi:hypothetical protein
MNRVELQRARAFHRQKQQNCNSENDPNVQAIVAEMASTGASGIFGTLGTDSMMEDRNNQNFMGKSRRSFPDQSAMRPINRDCRPGKQEDGGVKQHCKRQFPKKNACKSIDRTPVQHFIEQQEQHQRKRALQAPTLRTIGCPL